MKANIHPMLRWTGQEACPTGVARRLRVLDINVG